ncbi:MAG: hypothetical protein HYZ29_36380 [Myxococcales bacterium]|nr:hypothetical protein [Myxococcales bacterium]
MATSYPYFNASRNALDAITRLYDFVWPTAAALWNLRWQVAGYNDIRGGTTTVEELKARFIEGSGIHGANLHRACIEHTWDQQRSDLAFVVLVNLFAVYESWTVELMGEIGAAWPKGVDAKKVLQFPSSTDKQGTLRGIGAELQHLTSSRSGGTAELHAVLVTQKGVHPKHLDDMLVVYRYFKECRNSLMHLGGRATSTAVTAAAAMAALPTSVPFTIPKHAALVLHAPVILDLYGTVGFSDVLRRLVLTIDAELTVAVPAEKILLNRWRQEIGVVQLSRDAKKRHSALVRHMRKLGLPTLASTTKLGQALQTAGLVK